MISATVPTYAGNHVAIDALHSGIFKGESDATGEVRAGRVRSFR